MNRREFLAALGLGAAAVTFNGLPWPEPTPIVDGVVGAPTVSLAEAFRVGDVFTIEGRYAVNPITREATRHLQTFVVTSVTDGGGVVMSPRIRE